MCGSKGEGVYTVRMFRVKTANLNTHSIVEKGDRRGGVRLLLASLKIEIYINPRRPTHKNI